MHRLRAYANLDSNDHTIGYMDFYCNPDLDRDEYDDLHTYRYGNEYTYLDSHLDYDMDPNRYPNGI